MIIVNTFVHYNLTFKVSPGPGTAVAQCKEHLALIIAVSLSCPSLRMGTDEHTGDARQGNGSICISDLIQAYNENPPLCTMRAVGIYTVNLKTDLTRSVK